MAHPEAATLAQQLEKGPLSAGEVLRCALEVGSALAQLHRQGSAYGCLHPTNVVLTPAGAKLADPPSPVPAVSAYTAPEVLGGAPPTARADIFAFGAIVYEMATGQKPFAAVAEEELRRAILECEPALTSPVPGLDRVLADCLLKDPDRRRQRIQNVIVELKLIAGPLRAATRRAPATAAAKPVALPPVSAPAAAEQKPPAARHAMPSPPPAVAAPPHAPLQSAGPVLETAQAPAAMPGVPGPAPLSIEPTSSPRGPLPAFPQPHPVVEPMPVESRSAAPAETAAAPPAAEHAETPERKASAILSQIGFGEEPAFLQEKKKRGLVVRIKLPPQFRKLQAINWSRVLRIAAIAGIVAALALAAGAYFRRPAGTVGFLKFSVPAPEQASYASSPAISPDGRLLAFSAYSSPNKRQLWIRPLDSLQPAPLAGTEDALAPFWSPDGQYLAFFAGKKLKKVAVAGGSPEVLCDTDGLAGGGTWNREGEIVFGRSFYEGLYRVAAKGGPATSLTRLDAARGERAHLWPRFLPDGKHFLFYALADADENTGVRLGSLDSKEIARLVRADTNAIYAEQRKPDGGGKTGYLLYAQGHHLLAQPFDAASLKIKGLPSSIAQEISYLQFVNLLPISASDNGLLAYQSIDVPKRQLAWFDRAGNQVGAVGDPGEYGQVKISADGQRVIVNRLTAGKDTADLWILSANGGNATRLTSDPGNEGAAVWSPDDRYIFYYRNPSGHYDLYRRPVGEGREELLLATPKDKYPNDVSPDGRYLLYGEFGASTNSDLWILPLFGDRKPFVYLQTIYTEGYGQFSPDGKLVAYQSDISGRAEVYVEPFPRVESESRRWQISVDGGGLPKWRNDGKELFFITARGEVLAVEVTPGANPGFAAPRLLFQSRALPRAWNPFDATGDGQRFLVNSPLEWASSSPITVVANWTEGFKK